MPLCLVEMHSAHSYQVSDRLTIAIPHEVQCVGYRDLRIGKAFLTGGHNVEAQKWDCTCSQKLRERGVVSFIGCALHGLVGALERKALEEVARNADYLVLDLNTTSVDLWENYIAVVRGISRRVGLYVKDAGRMPYEVLATWIAKAVCDVGPKGIVFVEGLLPLISRVGDELEAHPFSGGSGKLIPVIPNGSVLDIEPFVIESKRTFTAGVGLHEGAVDGRFILWNCACEMIGKGESLRSMLYGEKCVDLQIESLLLERALRNNGNVALHKARVEELLSEAEKELIGDSSFQESKQNVDRLLIEAGAQVVVKRPFLFQRNNCVDS
jgi:hypothetical protein